MTQSIHFNLCTNNFFLYSLQAILCIYFLLFSLLIYANWNTFNQYNHRKKSRRQERRQQRKRVQQLKEQQQMLLPPASSSTPPGALDSVVCLSETASASAAADGIVPNCTLADLSPVGGGKEPTGSHTTTMIVSHPGKVVHFWVGNDTQTQMAYLLPKQKNNSFKESFQRILIRFRLKRGRQIYFRLHIHFHWRQFLLHYWDCISLFNIW